MSTPTRGTTEIDATNESIGRLATRIAYALQGKHHASYVPHIDSGDFVVVKNMAKVKITGRKLDQKKYYKYSGYPGGLRSTLLSVVMAKDPSRALKNAVSRMLPKNRLRTPRLKRLTVHN
jgi:large subunit ribosomal protein L13